MFKWIARRWRRRSLKRGIDALKSFDYLMSVKGISRRERRRFWSEFVKSVEVREQTFKKIEKEMKLNDE